MASDDTDKKLDMSLDQIVQERKTDAPDNAGKAKSTKRAERIAQSSPYQVQGRNGDADVDMEQVAAVGCRVYVGNLSWSVKWQDLKDHMQAAGPVELATVLEWNGRSKGCGVVTYATEEAVQNAIDTLNDSELGGRKIFVREDRETQPIAAVKPKRGFRVYVGNLSWNVKWQELKDHMKKAGTVVHADVLEESNGRSKGCGLVEYATQDEANKAIAELNNSELEGRLIFVREDREPEGGSISKLAKRAAAPRGNGEGRQLYVGNLPWETNWQQLKDLFRTVGEVERADIAEYPDGRSRGFGIIRYTNAADAWQAIERLNGLEIEGRLIEKLNVNEMDKEGSHALYMAAQNESLEVLELLLTNGANVDQQQGDGKTALHAACTWGRIEAARLLLAHEASIESRDNDGQSPLHCACRNGHEELVRLLLDSGVDLFMSDDYGATPIDVARDWQRLDILEMLAAYRETELLEANRERVELAASGLSNQVELPRGIQDIITACLC
ncbi:hypothetical protein PRNP1_008380 [Phytophthora ramorum]